MHSDPFFDKIQDMNLGIYRHYKGNFYRVIGAARHTETLEELVVYQSLYGDFGIWVRPLSMFLEEVEWEGRAVPRFVFYCDAGKEPPAFAKR